MSGSWLKLRSERIDDSRGFEYAPFSSTGTKTTNRQPHVSPDWSLRLSDKFTRTSFETSFHVRRRCDLCLNGICGATLSWSKSLPFILQIGWYLVTVESHSLPWPMLTWAQAWFVNCFCITLKLERSALLVSHVNVTCNWFVIFLRTWANFRTPLGDLTSHLRIGMGQEDMSDGGRLPLTRLRKGNY